MPFINVAPAQRTHSAKTDSTNEDQMEVSTNMKIEDGNNGSNTGTCQELYDALRPMLLTMKVFGMFPLKETTIGKGLGSRVMWFYSGIMLVLIWGFTFVCISSLRFTDTVDRLIYQLILVVFHIYVSCQGTVVFLMCVRMKGWRELFNVYQHAQQGVWPAKGYSHVHRRIYFYVGASWFSTLCSVSFVIYNAFWEERLIDFYPFYDPKTYNLALRCYVVIEYIIMDVYWIILITLSLLLNDLVATDFRLFNERLQLEERECPLQLCTNLGKIRDVHKRLTNVTTAVDTLLSALVSFCIIFNLINSCCSVYTLIYNSHKLMDAIGYIFWTTFSLIVLFATTGACAWVNKEAHGSLGIVVDLRVTEVTDSFNLQMQMFLSKLTGSSIGITALNLFVIDKNTILTIVGMLVTYIIVFLQFKPSTPTCDCWSGFTNVTVCSAP